MGAKTPERENEKAHERKAEEIGKSLDRKTIKNLHEKLEQVRKSTIWTEIGTSLDGLDSDIKYLRCLGLGSVSESRPAMYQLQILSLIMEKLGINPDQVSVWDPVFNKEDTSILTNMGLKVSETSLKENTLQTLFYLPHFPISALEEFFTNQKPKYILCNDLTIYSHKFTDEKYFVTYPNSARLTKMIIDDLASQGKENKTLVEAPTDGFQVVKRKTSKARKNVKKYVPPAINYRMEEAYFTKVSFSIIKSGNDLSHPWHSAFSDLSFMKIE